MNFTLLAETDTLDYFLTQLEKGNSKEVLEYFKCESYDSIEYFLGAIEYEELDSNNDPTGVLECAYD